MHGLGGGYAGADFLLKKKKKKRRVGWVDGRSTHVP
jgi:NADH dehydrogenase FAD-containing subunit